MGSLAYKGCRIRTAAHRIAGTGEWEAEAIIHLRRGRSIVEHVFPAGCHFATKEAAERASLELGMRIVDGSEPGVRV